MKRGMLTAMLLAGAVYCVAPAAFAQNDAGTIETVIVTGRKAPEQEKIPMKAAYTESTISKEKILNATPSPTMSVQTLLSTEPSIYATTAGPNGNSTDIKFRSFVDGEFGETLAGVPLNDIFNSGVTFQADTRNTSLLTVRDLDSVQIYRGVNNPDVNTYNSLGGTINFTPRQPTDDFGGDIGIDGGSFNTFNYHAVLNTGDIDGVKQTISFEHQFSSGWHQNSPDFNDNIYYAGNADLGRTQLYAYGIYNKNAGDAPQFIPVNVLNTFGRDYEWANNNYNMHVDDENALAIVGGKSKISDIISVQFNAYAGSNDYQRTSFSNPDHSPFSQYFFNNSGIFPFWIFFAPPSIYNPITVFGSGPAGTDYQFYGYHGTMAGGNAKVSFDLPYNNVTVGGDWNVGWLHSREYWWGTYNMPMTKGFNDAWDETDTRQMYSGFIQDDIHFWDDRVHITPGVKYIGSILKDNDALGFFYVPPGSLKSHQNYTSPTLGASVEVADNLTVYGSYGKNVKFPDISALYNELGFGGAVPPSTTKPEFVTDYELGVRYKLDNLQLELNGYQENFSDIIFSVPVPGGFGATEQLNGGKERFRGLEFQGVDDFGEIGVGNLKGYLNASYNEAVCTTATSNFLSGGSCNPGEQLSNVPNYLLNAGVTWDYQGWHVDLQGHYVGIQHLKDWNTGLPEPISMIQPGQPTKIPDYLLFNVGIVKVVPISFGQANAFRFALNVDNLFNERYYTNAETNTDTNNSFVGATQLNDVYAETGAPRSVFGSVSIYF